MKLRRIGEMKAGQPFQDLLDRSPPEFAKWFDHVRNLAFDVEPDYVLLRGILVQRMEQEGWERDGKYDWTDPALCPQGTLIPEEYQFDEEIAGADTYIEW